MCESDEAVQVELSLEGGQLGMLEVHGKYFRYELLGFVDEEGTAMRLPRNNVGVSLRFRVFHHFV